MPATEDEEYYFIVQNNRKIVGMVLVKRKKESIPESRWAGSIAICDADTVSKKVTSLGGSIVLGPMEFRDRGHLAQVVDPQGAVFILLQSAQGDPDRLRLAEGYPVWIDLVTKSAAGT